MVSTRLPCRMFDTSLPPRSVTLMCLPDHEIATDDLTGPSWENLSGENSMTT